MSNVGPKVRAVAGMMGWLTVIIGAGHLALTPMNYDLASLNALWFAGSGLAVILVGAMTLLAAHGAVRVLTVVTNSAGLRLAIAFGMLTGWEPIYGPVVVVLFLVGGTASLVAGGSSR